MKAKLEIKRTIRKFIGILLSTLLCCSTLNWKISSVEYSVSDTVKIYQEKLERFNEKYQTSFCFDTENKNDEELSKMIAPYVKMSDEEFEEFFINIKNNYESWLSNLNKENESHKESNFEQPYDSKLLNNSPDPTRYPNVPQTQSLYYSASYNENRLIMYSTANFSSGWGIYISIDGVDSYIDEYPAYVVLNNSSYSSWIHPYNGYCTVTCNFSCVVWVWQNVYVTDSDCVIQTNFLAGGGDVYSYTTI